MAIKSDSYRPFVTVNWRQNKATKQQLQQQQQKLNEKKQRANFSYAHEMPSMNLEQHSCQIIRE